MVIFVMVPRRHRFSSTLHLIPVSYSWTFGHVIAALAAWKRLRFEKRYDWFRDCGDKEVVKDPSKLSSSAWCSWVILTKSFGWSMWIIIDQWVICWSGKCMHHSGNLAIFQEQKGPPFMRYDPGKPVMAGSTRGIPRNWGMTGAWEEWRGPGVHFWRSKSWELQIFGIDQYSISYRNLLEISWYIHLYRILRCAYIMSLHVFTDFTVLFYLMICVNMCRHKIFSARLIHSLTTDVKVEDFWCRVKPVFSTVEVCPLGDALKMVHQRAWNRVAAPTWWSLGTRHEQNHQDVLLSIYQKGAT